MTRGREPRGARRALDAAGIADPALRASYLRCRELHARFGKTYFLATLLLPPAKRPFVNALYGLARHADEFVDDLADPRPADLVRWSDDFLSDLARGRSEHDVNRAAVHTITTWGLDPAHFVAFVESMQMDITVTGYPTYADLERYMYGSAAVIGLQMLPILEPLDPEAAPRAHALGVAFQLTNFLRDVGEDLQRGRVYLPQEDLDAFGVTRADLAMPVPSARVVALLRHEVERTRALYRYAEGGIPMLHPSSRPCIRTALRLYGGILDEVERDGYAVVARRATVPQRRRVAVAVPEYVRARRDRGDADTRVRARVSFADGQRSSPRLPHQTQSARVDSTRANPKSTSSTGA